MFSLQENEDIRIRQVTGESENVQEVGVPDGNIRHLCRADKETRHRARGYVPNFDWVPGRNPDEGLRVYNQLTLFEHYAIPRKKIRSIDFSKQLKRKPVF